VNQTLLVRLSAVPTPLFALDVQRGGIPGHPGAYLVESLTWFNPDRHDGAGEIYFEIGIVSGSFKSPE
jgi:hypothetical protein